MIILDTKVTRSTLAGLKQKIPLVVHQGGTYSGKTFNNLIALALYAHHNKNPLIISVIGQTIPHLKQGALRDWDQIDSELKFSHAQNKQDKSFQINNSILEFYSVDKLGKAKGAKRDILFVNEANYMDYTIYKQLALRTNQTVIIDFNPTGEFWFHDYELPNLKQGEYIYKRTTYKDNPGLPEGKAKEIEGLKHTDKYLYDVYALGITGKQQGLIYNKLKLIDEMPESHLLSNYGYFLDFGYSSDPTAFGEAGLINDRLYSNELIYEKGLTNNDIVQRFDDLGVSKIIPIIADSAEPKSITEIRQAGYNIRGAVKGPDSIKNGISKLKEYKHHLTTNSINARKEYNNYKWLEKNGKPLNIPVDKFNHYLDGLRYWASKSVQNVYEDDISGFDYVDLY